MIFRFKPNILFLLLVICLSIYWKASRNRQNNGNSWINNFSPDDYFGQDEIHADDETVYQYKVAISDERIDNLKKSMKLGVETVLLKRQGNPEGMQMNLQFLKEISDALHLYSWKQHQHFINTFRHYRTEIEGLRIHFVRNVFHDSYERVYPIILLHGWQSSFWEFYKIIPILSNPDRFGFNFGLKGKIAFDVIVPSIPGLIFSEHPSRTGLGLLQVARILAKLADRLSLSHYFVYGHGEVSSQIADMIALLRPEGIAGLYLLNRPPSAVNQDLISVFGWFSCILGFMPLKPQCSAGGSENDEDSRGLAKLINLESHLHDLWLLASSTVVTGMILDHWASKTDPNYPIHSFSNLSSFFTIDDLLTNIILHWTTDSPVSMFQLLKSSSETELLRRSTVSTPTAILISPTTKRLSTVQEWEYTNHYWNITRFRVEGQYGNFLALRNADLLAEEIFSFAEILNLSMKE